MKMMFHSKMKMGDMMKTVIIDDDLEFARYLKDEINQCDMISMDILFFMYLFIDFFSGVF